MARTSRPGRTRPASVSPLMPRVEGVQVPGPAPESNTAAGTRTTPPPATAGPHTAELPTSGSAGLPKFKTLERKDTRLRADQLADLTALARRVSSQRSRRVERITDNTLIRVAVDLLLARGDQLHGDTEEQLLGSLRTEVPESGSS